MTGPQPPGVAVAAAPVTARLSARPARAVLLGTVLLVAVCGFVYELVIIAMGTYLLGNSVEQVSIVLGTFVSSMGLGSLVSKPLMRAPVLWFAVIEAVLALVGGLSAIALYASFSWLDVYQPVVIGLAASIGLLVGCEIPLLLVLIQRVRAQEAGTSVADLLAADYFGAMVAGVAFPLLMLPLLGQIDTALAIGALNLVAGFVVLWLLGSDLAVWTRRAAFAAFVAVLGVLGSAAAFANRFEVSARQQLYRDPIVRVERTPYQEIVMTETLGGRDLRLFLNGDLQFSSRDERRYHEALVHPAMAGPHGRVLVLGGGDGLALREILRYRDVRTATLVELDQRVLDLARADERLTALNGSSFRDPRVRTETADAFGWLREAEPHAYDVIVADFPDPDDAAVGKLYSVEIYGLMRRALAPGGRIVAQSGSPSIATKAYWSVAASLEAAGLRSVAYHVDVPSFGNWGFHLAAAGAATPLLQLRTPAPLRTLDRASLQAAATFPPDRRRPRGNLVSTLNHPRIVGFTTSGYRDY